MGPVRSEKWLNWAAYGTWLIVTFPTLAEVWTGDITGSLAAVIVVAFVAFGVGFVLCGRQLPRPLFVALLVVQTIAAFVFVMQGNGTAAALLVIVAAQAAAGLPIPVAWGWVAIQSLAVGAIWYRFDGWIGAITVTGAFGGFQAFAIATMSLARAERKAREELSRAHAELVATQSLLAENSRIAERLRISRDLHDTLGHHLTALSLQLDVASRLTSGQATQHVTEAHAIARLLLSDVRNVVSEMRHSSRVDLAESMRALAGAGALRIHLDMPSSLPLDDAGQAHALLRSVQEIITNATRHSGARNLWIRLERRDEGIDLHARDDGQGTAELKWGNGLRGMRERFEEFSGRVEFKPGAGRGFEVHGFMPGAETAS